MTRPFEDLLAAVTEPLTASVAGHSVVLSAGRGSILLPDGTAGPADVLIRDSSEPPLHLMTIPVTRLVAPGNSVEIDLTRMEWS